MSNHSLIGKAGIGPAFTLLGLTVYKTVALTD